MFYGALGRIGIRAISGTSFSPILLFANGEQGAWYDPSDFSTMFQDSAGTIPVTAVEQPVGKILDKSGRGNHASQATAASRPVLSARVNLLTYSEQFDNAIWNKANLNTTWTPAWVNVQTAPDGTLTADKLIESNTTAQHYVSGVPTVTSGLTYTLSFYLKAEERTWTFLEFYGGIPAGNSYVNLSTGAKGTTTGSASALTVTETSTGSGWWRIELPGFVASSTTPAFAVYTSTGNGVNSYAGDGTSGIYIWGADIRVTNDGVGIPAYQRVGAATYGTSTVAGNPDYNTSGFPLYLKFDGTDDSLVTGAIDLTATNSVSVFSGVRKLSDAQQAVIAMFGPSGSTANFLLFSSNGSLANYFYQSKGSITPTGAISPSSYVAPITNVVSGLSTISSDSAILRVNGVVVATDSGDQGTGNYTNTQLYIGIRSDALLPFNGRIYSLIVRGAQSTESTIDQTEVWVGNKTGLDLSYATQQTIFDRFNAAVLDRLSAIILQRY